MTTVSAPDANPALAFSIAAVPDVAGLKRLHGLPETLADDEVVEFAYQKSRARADTSNAPDELPEWLHRVVSIAAAWHDGQQFRIASFADDDEATLIQRFLDLLADGQPMPVSWQGKRFDLPVLQCRGLQRGVGGGQGLVGARDLAECLGLAPSALNGLYDLGALCGLPHKTPLPEVQAWSAWHAGRAEQIHAACETDALTCYVLHLRFQLMRGEIDATQFAQQTAAVRDALQASGRPLWLEFLASWS